MTVRPALVFAFVGCLLAHPAWAAEEDEGCAHHAIDVAPRIKAVLGPHYAKPVVDPGTLQTSFRELEILLLEIGHCRAAAQSIEHAGGDRQAEITEWHTLNQWLYRLVNFVGLNARGDTSVDWRDEYSLFAEVYEFEP
ncbi:MAG: hypothetical protein H6977_19030 [Gammaproteobacteria bacterium]|nr:hypothetical protein [Planctomycetota bacterium]MCB1747482.1 hypothetical protein [Gammaproteobacteria bacterium]MCP5202097.1 hypothetical protein [Gammaproteobacteria bacterium]